MHKKRYIVPVFVPHKGCPNDCLFCNQYKIANHVDIVNGKDIYRYIEKQLSYFPDNEVEREIAFYGGSFTGLDRGVMKEYLSIAQSFIQRGCVAHTRVSTRPDYIDEEILDVLEAYGIETIELGVQSTNGEVLKANNRGHTTQDVFAAAEQIKGRGFVLGLQMMPGLYRDNRERILQTASDFCEIKPDMVRIYPTLVLKETKLEVLWREGLYHPLTLEEAVEICEEIYELFLLEDIEVIRMGLQPTENINDDGDVIAGPFHPAFRSLVESTLYRELLDDAFKNMSLEEKTELTLRVHPSKLSFAVGMDGRNKKFFINKYGLKQIRFIGDGTDPQSIDVFYEGDKHSIKIMDAIRQRQDEKTWRRNETRKH